MKEKKELIQPIDKSAIDKIDKVNDFGNLKPVGKLMGNNFFTFHQPNIEELFNTLNSFPEPKYLFASENILLNPMIRNLQKTEIFVLTNSEIENGNHISWQHLGNLMEEIKSQNAMIIISLNQKDIVNHSENLNTILASLKS